MKLMDADGSFPNLMGAAIGDGCWGNEVGLLRPRHLVTSYHLFQLGGLCAFNRFPSNPIGSSPPAQVGLCAFNSGKAQQIQMQTFFGHSMISNQRFAALEKVGRRYYRYSWKVGRRYYRHSCRR
jgi:hypothetical protein